MSQRPSLFILGTRGVPAAHGGFETFAERFALHMAGQDWDVTVYCQADAGPKGPVEDVWRGVRRITFSADGGALGTMAFDWMCVRHALGQRGVMLVLGYNTALFSALLRLRGKPLITNMDGIEWKRAKWPWHGRIWLYLNEWIGALTSTTLVADHPEIARHLARRRNVRDIVMIPYGADPVTEAPEAPVRTLGLTPGRYLISIGRIEPENNILTMVRAFASRPRDLQFICLGKLDPERNPYHAEVLRAGEGRVLFPGAIYDPEVVKALRFHAAAYCHGHSVGGTNPSLVEALGAGNAIIAHDNPYNRWVAGEGQFYFGEAAACEAIFTRIEDAATVTEVAQNHSRQQFAEHFTWAPVLSAYEVLCQKQLPRRAVGVRNGALRGHPDSGQGGAGEPWRTMTPEAIDSPSPSPGAETRNADIGRRLALGFDAHVLDGRFQGSRTVISNIVTSLANSSDDITVHAYSSRSHFDKERVFTHPISKNPVSRLVFDLAFAPRRHDLHAMVYQYICAPWAQRSWVTIHDVLPLSHPHLFNIRFTIRCAALFISSMLWARKVITVSSYTSNAVSRLLPWISHKLVVVRNGPSFHEDTYFAEHDKGAGTPYVMTVGRLERRKNVDLLMAAFARAGLTNVNLVVVGKREPGYRIDMAVPNVIHIEDAPEETLIDLYRNASLFVYPSAAEGFGLPLLDAVLFGVPTLSSDQTAMPEVGGDLAEYFDPTAKNAVDHLAKRIRSHFTGSPVERPSLEARRRHADAFSWRRSAAALVDALRRDAL